MKPTQKNNELVYFYKSISFTYSLKTNALFMIPVKCKNECKKPKTL